MEALDRSEQQSDEQPLSDNDYVPVQQNVWPNQVAAVEQQRGVQAPHKLPIGKGRAYALRISNVFRFKQWFTD